MASWRHNRVAPHALVYILGVVARFNACIHLLLRGLSLYATSERRRHQSYLALTAQRRMQCKTRNNLTLFYVHNENKTLECGLGIWGENVRGRQRLQRRLGWVM